MKLLILYLLIFLHRLPWRWLFLKKKKSPSILILKIDAIGDSIIWLDSAKEYRKHFPNHHLVLCYKKEWRDIALKLSYFDEFIEFDQNQYFKKIGYRYKFLKVINTYHYEQVINPTFSRNFFIQDWIIHSIYADQKIGSVGDYNNTNNTLAKLTSNFTYFNTKLKAIADPWYTTLVPASSGTKMELVRNAEFVRAYLDAGFQANIPEFPFPIERTFSLPFENYILFFMGASTERRMWDVKKFAEIASKFIEKYPIVVCGSPNENFLYESLVEHDLDKNKILNLCGKTNLIELITIIKDATWVLTNETAASHIAVATKTPSVCILGGGHFGRFQPYEVEQIEDKDKKYLPHVAYYPMDCFGCGWICKYPLIDGRWKCIHNIDVDMVVDKINEIV